MYTANGDLQSKTDAPGITTYTYDEIGNLITVLLPMVTTMREMESAGMSILTRMIVVAAAAVVGSSASFANLHAEGQPKTNRESAMDWAVAQRAEAFDRLMPRASSYDVVPGGTAVSLRSPGFEDAFEFEITVLSSPGNEVRGLVVVTVDEPLTVQLARLRDAGCVSLDECLSRVRVQRRTLDAGIATFIRDRLARVCVPISSLQKGLHHKRQFEITVAGWGELRLTVTGDEHARGPAREVLGAIDHILKDAKVSTGALDFDPRPYYSVP